MNKKRGFTLIEIIICIALIAIIGTTMTFVVIKSNKNKQIKILENNNKILENALEVYLENHEEIQYNLENNAKGAVVTLEVLKNEGLIDEKQFKGVELKKNYFFLSYSMLDNKPNTDCENNVIPLSIVENWKVDTNKVVYICPRTDNGNNSENSGGNNSSDENNSSIINQFGISGYYIARGSNPNNWVKFEVTAGNSNNDYAYFPNDEDKDLWRVVSIDENGGIRLIYNKSVDANNNKNYQDYNKKDDEILEKGAMESDTIESLLAEYTYTNSGRGYCIKNNNIETKCFYPSDVNVRYKRTYYNFEAYYKLNKYYNYNFVEMNCIYGTKNKSKTCNFVNAVSYYNTKKGFSILDLYDSSIYSNDDIVENTKLNFLYNNITNKNYIDYVDTNIKYNGVNGIYSIDRGTFIKTKFQTLTTDDITNSILFGKSWLYNYNVISGIFNNTKTIELNGGNTASGPIINQGETDCYVGRNGEYCYYNWSPDAYQILTGSYAPVIVLKHNVKLKKNNSCNEKNLGTKKCPYTLEWVDDIIDESEETTETE